MFGQQLRRVVQYAEKVASRVPAAQFAANAAPYAQRNPGCEYLEKDNVSIVQGAFLVRTDGYQNARDERGVFDN